MEPSHEAGMVGGICLRASGPVPGRRCPNLAAAAGEVKSQPFPGSRCRFRCAGQDDRRDEETTLTPAESPEDDRGIARRALEGDQRAYRALYDGNVDRIFRLAFRMLGDEEAAREATQKAFIRAFQSLDQFRGDAAFSTWLHRVAISVILNERRVAARLSSREIELDDGVAPGRTPPPEVEVGVRIKKAVEGLSEIYKTVFLMHDVEGYKHEEIADLLGVAVGTSKARLSRARSMLRQALGGDAQAAV